MKMKTRRMRPVWKGTLQFSLVSIPVRAVTAKVKDGSEIDLDWLHADCHSKIKNQKVCPIHGEVSSDEIVSAYKYSKNQYVEIDPDELGKVRTKSEKLLDVDVLIPPDAIDYMYFTDKSYYLLPEDNEAARPYVVFQQALARQERFGIAQAVLFRRDHVVCIRPKDDLLLMTVLSYHHDFKDAASLRAEAPRVKASTQEIKLADTLVKELTAEDFDLVAYRDPYADKLKKLIDAKVKGREIETPPQEEEPGVLDFSEALRKSLEKARRLQHHRNGRAHRGQRRKVS